MAFSSSSRLLLKTSTHLAGLLCGWFLLTQSLLAVGVAVTKEQRFHADKSAKPFVFEKVDDYGKFVIFDTGYRLFSVDRATFVEYVESPQSLPVEMIREEQVAPVREAAGQIRAFSVRFPLSEPLLRENLATLQAVLGAYDAGSVFYGRKWIARTEYEAVQRQILLDKEKLQREQAIAAQIRAAELNALALSQVQENSVAKAAYRLYQPQGEGALLEMLEPASDPPLVVYVEDPGTLQLIPNVRYEGSLYYSGSYKSEDGNGNYRAYCFDRRSATARLALKFSRSRADYLVPTIRSWSNRPKATASDSVWVNGYFRQDGTWVSGHYRQPPSTNITPFQSTGSSTGLPSYGGDSSSDRVSVRGYYRKNGTYVRPHTRRR